MLRQRLFLGLIAGLLALSVLAAAAGCSTQAAWPTKPIEIVVTFAAGGGTDVTVRVMAKYLSAELGVPVNVVNKPGGNQIPGVLAVMNAAPDGYTLLSEQQATSSAQSILKDLPYKIEERTFGPLLSAGPNAFVAQGKSPWNSLKDVAEAAKKDPAAFTWGNLGGMSNTTTACLQFFDAAGVDVGKAKAVPFDGGGPALTAVAGGHLQFVASGVSAVFPLLASGDIKVLAVTGDKRMPSLPNVPSAKELGYPTVDMISWFGFSGPKTLPKNVVDKLDAVVKKISADPNFAKEMDAGGRYVDYQPPDKARERVLKEVSMFNTLYTKFPAFK